MKLPQHQVALRLLILAGALAASAGLLTLTAVAVPTPSSAGTFEIPMVPGANEISELWQVHS